MHHPGGLKTTERALAESRNRAVLPVLAGALCSAGAAVRAVAIRATMRRRDLASHTQLLRGFDRFDEADKAALRHAYQAMPHHAAPALKAALSQREDALSQSACQFIETCHAYELFETLVNALNRPQQPRMAQIAATIDRLARTLHEELAKWAQGDRNRPDPTFARRHVLAAVEKSLAHSKAASRQEVVDAFFLLTTNDNELLLRIMRDEQHPAHGALAGTLAAGTSVDIIERLVEFLHDSAAPKPVLEAIALRTDRVFVECLFQALKHPVPLRVLHNMKQLQSVAWLESQREILLELDGRGQATAVDLAMASGIDPRSQFELLKLLLSSGLAEGRRASCQALARFDSRESTELVLAALSDPDVAVQAAALRQLRQRRAPNALELLVAQLNSPSSEIRDAARSSLAEFNFVRYRAMFDLLDEEALRTTGALVRQVDPSAREKLAAELAAPSIAARMRGIEMTVAMEAAQDVCEQLIELSRHENVAVRKEAVTALGHAEGPRVVDALVAAARDSNRSVAEAAKQSLARHSAKALGASQPSVAAGATS
jgi:HEAT repeat protein